MSLRDFLAKQFIEVIEWNEPQDGILSYRFPMQDQEIMNGGKLTGQEKAIVNGQQNNLSGQIYNDKHNGATQSYGNSKVGARQENQQDRIANGTPSGKLSAGQTAHLEKNEAAVNQEVRTDRKLNVVHDRVQHDRTYLDVRPDPELRLRPPGRGRLLHHPPVLPPVKRPHSSRPPAPSDPIQRGDAMSNVRKQKSVSFLGSLLLALAAMALVLGLGYGSALAAGPVVPSAHGQIDVHSLRGHVDDHDQRPRRLLRG